MNLADLHAIINDCMREVITATPMHMLDSPDRAECYEDMAVRFILAASRRNVVIVPKAEFYRVMGKNR